MTHSKEVLDVLIERRVAHLRLLAAQTAQQYWKDQPQKPLSERFDELVQRALARRAVRHVASHPPHPQLAES